MIQSPLNEFLQEIACGLSVPHAANDALTFMRLSGAPGVCGSRTAYSDVARGPLPLELSFSQASGAELRLLTEPCLPGEGILARTVMGIAAVGDVVAGLFSSELAQQAQDLVRRLLPDAEEIGHLNWRSSIWLALRTTGDRLAVRIYVNAQFRNAQDRWPHIGRALLACGLRESSDALKQVRRAVEELLQPIGLCFDVRSSGLTPARVHCVTERISPFWLLRLLAATNNEAAGEDAADFMELFSLLERQGECPVLVSLGLGQRDVGSLKIDVDVPSLQPNAGADRAQYLGRAEARFGKIAEYHAVRGMLDCAEPRYIGITITPAARFLNVYFPCSFRSAAGDLPSPDVAFGKARAFVHAEMESAGALLMDARSSCAVRAVPQGWRDLYMTCLLVQEHSPVLCLECESLERARSFIRASREEWCWRYLPDLPCDLDDTAMAWTALDPSGCGIDSEVVERVMAMANSDGGFRTFIGEEGGNQPSHPAVTLNIALALDQGNASWPSAATDQYLRRWLQQQDFPACQWIGSRVFPIFLFSRAASLLERLGAKTRDLLATRVTEMRRADGTWGWGLPDSLDTALAVLSLDRLGAPVPDLEMLEHLLLSLQFDDGGWGWSPLYSDGSGTWFGHRAITTAFAIRALEILRRAQEPMEGT